MIRKSRGFALPELLFVIVIKELLTEYVGPKYLAKLGKSEIKTTTGQINALEKVLDNYRFDTGHYPTTEQGLTALLIQPAKEPKWQGAYPKKVPPAESWGNPYIHKSPSDHAEINTTSYSAESSSTGSYEYADIINWQ